MPIETLIAYVLLTLACCTGVAATYVLLDIELYTPVPALLGGSIFVNIVRRLLASHPFELPLTDRVLFFAWPLCVLALLGYAFESRFVLRFLLAPLAALILAFSLLIDGIPNRGVIETLGQITSGMIGIVAIALLVMRGRRAAFLSRLEMAAFFMGATEGLAALVGYLVPGVWWPAVVVYCLLYLALVLLHGHVLWSHRRTTSHASAPISL